MMNTGIDMHESGSQICKVTPTGVPESLISTRRERVAEVLGTRPRARILVEASQEPVRRHPKKERRLVTNVPKNRTRLGARCVQAPSPWSGPRSGLKSTRPAAGAL
jgi:hypothetical protein